MKGKERKGKDIASHLLVYILFYMVQMVIKFRILLVWEQISEHSPKKSFDPNIPPNKSIGSRVF